MATYGFRFTSNPADSANLSPTFLNFIKFDGTTLTPPGITQTNLGTGLYQFSYTPSFFIAFRIDGATSTLGSQRYVSGSLDVSDEYALQDVGASLGVIPALLGTTASIYGGPAADPTTLFGYMKRVQEFLEGNQTFNKATGAWQISSRLNATLLITKALVNDANGVTRS